MSGLFFPLIPFNKRLLVTGSAPGVRTEPGTTQRGTYLLKLRFLGVGKQKEELLTVSGGDKDRGREAGQRDRGLWAKA